MKEILVFAHRGASKEFPENTMSSFKRAAELGVDFIETDIHFTNDKRFAVIHDDSINRTTDGSGKAASYTMHDLKDFDAGYYFTKDNGKTYPYRGKGISLMSLEEMLDAFPEQRFNIDLKDKNPYQVRHFIEVIEKFNAYSRIIAVSEHFINLDVLRKMKPQIATSFSMREKLWLYFLYKSGFIFLNISFKSIFLQVPDRLGQFNVITRSFVKQMHKKGLQVHVWTINNEEDMRRLIDIEVDGIMSDDPALLLKLLGR